MIAVLRSQGASLRSIARQLQRNPSTISRELQRNAARRYTEATTSHIRRMPAPDNAGVLAISGRVSNQRLCAIMCVHA